MSDPLPQKDVTLMKMPDIYTYTEYATYLKDWFQETKETHPQVSYRFLTRHTGIDAGYILKIMQGAKHLSAEGVEAFIPVLQLDGRAAKYFRTMVAFNKAKASEEISNLFNRLCELRETHSKVIPQKQYRYWSQWYYPAVRLSLMNFDFRGDYVGLAERILPNISAQQAKEAIQTLLELELIEVDSDGVYQVKDLLISTGDAWTSAAIREFQSQTLELAKQSLHERARGLRSISTLSLAIPVEEVGTLKEMMDEFRRKVAKWSVGIGHSDCVIQLDLAAFPISMDPEVRKRIEKSTKGKCL
jgi:uncharacterized protein (TIGR02147 family)